MSGKADHVIFCPLCRQEGRRALKTFASLRALNIHLVRRHGTQYHYCEFGGTYRRLLGAASRKKAGQFA